METVDLLKQETPDFILPTLRPLDGPDLNPVDYAVWRILQDRGYKIKDVEGMCVSRKSGRS